jgi:hypothetical protein
VTVFWAAEVGDSWEEVAAEMERAFRFAREAASGERSVVFVVNSDDLLGRRGPGNAMLATGILSAARTLALEGWRKGWTANVVAWDGETGTREEAEALALQLAENGKVTGEVVRIGPGHIGKALP